MIQRWNRTVMATDVFTIVIVGVGSLVAILLVSIGLAEDVGESLTRNTIRLSMCWYATAMGLIVMTSPNDCQSLHIHNRRAPVRFAVWLTRWCWTWAVVCFIVHVAMAFHFYHHWSHADAFERTREISGRGEGIFVSYLFTVVWICDTLWWWLFPAAYATRSGWVGWILHGSMLFIVFNGTVVFAAGPIRWVGVMMFIGLFVWVCVRSSNKKVVR